MKFQWPRIFVAYCAFFICLSPQTLAASKAGPSGGSLAAQHMTARVVPQFIKSSAGKEIDLAVDIRLADGWVYYSPNPGASLEYSPLPAGMNVFVDSVAVKDYRIAWPKAHSHDTDLGDARVTNFVYADRAVVHILIKVPDAAGKVIKIAVEPTGQICKDACLDIRGVRAEASVEILAADAKSGVIENPQWRDDPAISAWSGKYDPIAELPSPVRQASASQQAQALEYGFGAAMLLALLAGLILNIMPCVLPIIPLRIYSIVQLAGQSRRRYVTMGLAFAGGIFIFFVGIAAANAAMQIVWQRTFHWAEHFQLVGVRVAMMLLLLTVAANMFGVFNVLLPSSLTRLEENTSRRSGHASAVGMGLMMAIFSTPCGFGILGAVLAWAQFQSLWVGTLAFIMIGVGMAAPHAILASFPSLIKLLPRPGRWMELFKQSMGFAMLLLVSWLIGTFDKSGYVGAVAAYCVVFAFALWMWGSWVTSQTGLAGKIAIRGIALLLAVGSGVILLPSSDTNGVGEKSAFDEAAVAEYNNSGKTVVVKFTAAWCTECKIVDVRIYKNKELMQELSRRGVVVMIGDATDRGSPASRWLERQGLPVPVTVVFRPGDQPAMLLGVFDKTKLLRAIGEP